MGVPIEKRLGNVQKALLTGMLDGGKSFDPNNPKDVKRRKELEKQAEALQSISSLVTDPTGGGLVGMAKGISKAAFANMSKSKFAQNKAKQIADLVTKPMTRGKKAVNNTRKQATPTVKEVVETKPTIPTTIPSTMELAQIPGSSAKTIKEGIKSFTGKTEKFVSKDPRLSSGKLQPFKDKKGLTEPNKLGVQNYGSGFTTMEYKAIDPSKALSSKPMKDIVREDMLKALKVSAGIGAAGAGVIMGTDYLRSTGSPESVRKTNLSKTGPVDLKRINKNNLKDSSIPGVKKITAIVNGEEKEFGIVWDNKTQSWDYYRGDKTKKTETPKPDLKREDVGGGYTPIKDNRGGGTGSGGKTTTGSGTGTTPRSTTAPKTTVDVGKTTTPIMGDEEYKKDPRLAILRQEDDDRQLLARAEAQKKEMESKIIQPLPTKPLSSLVFKTTAKAAESQKIRNSMDEQNALRSIIADNRMPLKKKRYGGNLAMLKYMKQ